MGGAHATQTRAASKDDSKKNPRVNYEDVTPGGK